MKEADLLSLGTNVKVVLFMETKPLSDTFQQLMFSPEAYIRVLDAIAKEMRPKAGGAFIVTCNDDFEFVFKDIPQSYSEKEMNV